MSTELEKEALEAFAQYAEEIGPDSDKWEDMGRDEIWLAAVRWMQSREKETHPPANPGPTLEWAVQKCKAMQDQGFDRVPLDVLQKDFENALASFSVTKP